MNCTQVVNKRSIPVEGQTLLNVFNYHVDMEESDVHMVQIPSRSLDGFSPPHCSAFYDDEVFQMEAQVICNENSRMLADDQDDEPSPRKWTGWVYLVRPQGFMLHILDGKEFK